jgi:hypothetical protein
MTVPAKRWFRGLSRNDKGRLHKWLAKNPPPKNFKGGDRIDWAYLEIPTGFITGRIGKII